MNLDQFIQAVLDEAQKEGILAAEIYLSSRDSFRAMCVQGQIANYTVNDTRGLSLRGLYQGKMGYAATEAFDEEAVSQLVQAVKESAALTEDEDVQEIYQGDAEYPKIENYQTALDQVEEQKKLDLIKNIEKKALAMDERITALNYNMISTSSSQTRIVNRVVSDGEAHRLDLRYRDNMAVCYASATAKEGDRVATGSGFKVTRYFEELNAEAIARDAVEEALFMLHASPVPSGTYRAVIDAKCMPDLLGVFAGVFSAESAQKGMSLLAGKEGEMIASEIVTLMDDPLLPGGLASQPFDAEGVATKTKAVIEKGKLTTLLHNLKTARKAGVKTTGNAAKAGYAGAVNVSPSNFFIAPGQKTQAELLADLGDGLVITEVSGLHAGANPISGDFSLIAQGYTVKNGKKDQPVEQITVAGNFYQLLKNIRAVGSDLTFPGSSIGSPSVDVGEIAVAGK
ncbi:MAG: TldD/PmbA family protein [Clostridia bacterium]|nr:TldD/PmbA family protein [Clostridia bacterium]